MSGLLRLCGMRRTLASVNSRKLRVIFLIAIALSVVAAGSSFAAKKQPEPETVLGCAQGSGYHFSAHPSRCTEFKGAHDQAHELQMVGIKWPSWGGTKAHGKGKWRYCCMGGEQRGPATLEASGRVKACGRRVYTKLRVKVVFPGNKKSTVEFKLPRC